MKTTTLLQQITKRTKHLIAIACFSLTSLSVSAYDVSINGSEYLKLNALLDNTGAPTAQLLEYDYTATPSTVRFHVVDPLVCASKGDSTTPTIVAQIQDGNGIEVLTSQNNIVSTEYDISNDQINIVTDDTIACATKIDAVNNTVAPPPADLLFENGFEIGGIAISDDIQLSLLKVIDSSVFPMITESFPTTPISLSNNQELEYQYTINNNSPTGSARTVDFVEFYNTVASNGPVFDDLQNWTCSISNSAGGTSCGSVTSGVGPIKLDNASIPPGERLTIYVHKNSLVSTADISNNLKLKMLASVFIVDAGNVDSNPDNNTTYQEFGSTLVTATQLVISSQPSNAVSGSPVGIFEVEFQDAGGIIDASNTSTVTVSIQNNPSNGNLSGTFTKAAVNGVATFADLSIDFVGTGYRLDASGGSFVTAPSNAFDVSTAAASQLVVTTQPADTVAGGVINAVTVELHDLNGNLVTSSGSLVQADIKAFTGDAGASLTGLQTITVTAGVATFNTLSIDLVETGYQLEFVSNIVSVSDINSNAFNITAVPVAANSEFGASVNSATAGTDISYSATIQDASGNVVGAGVVVNFVMTNTNANTPSVSCTTDITGTCSVNTVSTLTGTTLVAADINGTNIPNTTSGLFNSTTWQAGAPDGSMSNFWVDSATSPTGSTVSFVAEVKDQYGNFVTSVPVTFSLQDASGAVTPNFPSCTSSTNISGVCSVAVTSASTGATTATSAAAGFPSVIISNPTPPTGFGRVVTWQ